jgi:hypothetical protein
VGNALHVIASDYSGLFSYLRITTDLRVVSNIPVGLLEVPARDAVVASDGTLTVVVFRGVRKRPGGIVSDALAFYPPSYQIVAFDENSRELATRVIQPPGDEAHAPPEMQDNVLVIDGKVLLLTGTSKRYELKVMRLDRRLNTEAAFILKGSPEHIVVEYEWTLFARNPSPRGGVFMQVLGGTEVIELTSSGAPVRRLVVPQTRACCTTECRVAARDVWVGDQHVTVRGDYDRRRPEYLDLWLNWTIEPPDLSAMPPCPGAP